MKYAGVLFLMFHGVFLDFLCLLGEDAEEDEVEENPIAVDFQDVQDAFYMKDPRKALQGFFDREGSFFLFFY